MRRATEKKVARWMRRQCGQSNATLDLSSLQKQSAHPTDQISNTSHLAQFTGEFGSERRVQALRKVSECILDCQLRMQCAGEGIERDSNERMRAR